MHARESLLLTACLILLSATATRLARADAQACIASNEQGSILKSRGELSAARAAYLECAAESCPRVIREECQSIVARIDAAMPTVVLGVRGARGEEITAVRVLVDGRAHAPGVDGRSFSLDPGEHTIRFESGGRSRELRAIVREGEKNRPLEVELPADEPPPRPVTSVAASPSPAQSTRETRPVPALTYALAATGLVALGSFGYFALRGHAQQSDLQSRCAPSCLPEEARSMHSKYLAADVSLAIAALSLGGATYVYVTRPAASESFALRSPALLPAGLGLQVAGRF